MREDKEVVINPVKQSGLCAAGRAGAGVRAGDGAGLALAGLSAGRETGSEEGCSFLQPPLHMSPLRWGRLPFAWQQEQRHRLGHAGLSRVFTKGAGSFGWSQI